MSNTPPKVLTNTRVILELYLGNRERYSPSIRELGRAAGIGSTSVVNYHIRQLVAMGYLEKIPKMARGVFPTGKKINDQDFTKKGGRHGHTGTDLRQGKRSIETR